MHLFLRYVLLLAAAWMVPANALEESALNKTINSTVDIPAPVVVPPSEYFDGVDGQWSSFALRVGTAAQIVRVLVSTNSPETMVVLPMGCTAAAFSGATPPDCATSRGGLFNKTASSTWYDQGDFGINGNGVGFEANLGYSVGADYGLDTLGLGYVPGSNGPTLHNQTVAAIAATSPFYMGILGLSTQPVNYSTIGNFSAPSLFTTLRTQGLIPSLSYSYTAGAKYRLKAGQYAQLIFGGMDTSRYQPNAASFTLAGDIDRDMVVAVQSITYSGTEVSVLLSPGVDDPVYAFIESTDPNFWLPEAACVTFEKAFGISVDNSTGLYLINATNYASLVAINPQVVFTLGNSASGGATAQITLPFSAFALPASYPFTKNDTYYFPLRKAANSTQYTLGRAFLQEAYITVDYERRNFTVSQCTWVDGANSEISAIISPSYENSTSNNTSSLHSASKDDSKSRFVIILTVALVIVAVVGLVAAGMCVLRMRSKRRQHVEVAIKDSSSDKEAYIYGPGSVYPFNSPYSELGGTNSSSEIHQLPDRNNCNDDSYVMAKQQMESMRKAPGTPVIVATPIVFELIGSEPRPVELDDRHN
ncbi:hypothetical protein BP5796_12281 [Coleophoma crateriformis]|uniref:Peptidase A1 domain-containing protein n=1 Tax=Coleophoma crateriformis TaxID=565419 RepID=A0A3D8Q999_9HELO|nr:hypothetical protein BP5796_12281 [Coleophoma crateriformis]